MAFTRARCCGTPRHATRPVLRPARAAQTGFPPSLKRECMAESDRVEDRACNGTSGCAVSSTGGDVCRYASVAAATGSHSLCPCEEHCSCNPCGCGRAACTCGSGCTCTACGSAA